MLPVQTRTMLVSFRGGVWFPMADLSPSPRGHHPVLRRPWTRDDLLGRYDRFAERYGHWGRRSESRSQAFAGLLAGRAVVSGPGSDPLLCVGSVQPEHLPLARMNQSSSWSSVVTQYRLTILPGLVVFDMDLLRFIGGHYLRELRLAGMHVSSAASGSGSD